MVKLFQKSVVVNQHKQFPQGEHLDADIGLTSDIRNTSTSQTNRNSENRRLPGFGLE